MCSGLSVPVLRENIVGELKGKARWVKNVIEMKDLDK